MSDKLQWLNKHLILLRYLLISDAEAKENYKIRPDLADLFAGETNAENMVWKFADIGRFKCACELLAYIAHRRAAVWWVYNCVLSLHEELGKNPAAERDISEIGANFETTVPDFAKVEPPQDHSEIISKFSAMIGEMSADYQKARAACDPELLKYVEDGMEIAYKEFEKVHGIHPMKLMDKLSAKLTEEPFQIDDKSPIFKAAEQLKTQLQSVRKETLDTIKAVIPPKIPEYEKKRSDNAMQAVYRWIVSPDEVNSKKALEAGNECPDTPAGLLSLCAFWAGGNLMPGGEQVVRTPAGLAANGLNQVLLMCALHKGGTRKLKERYEHYFNLGVEVMIGKNNWDESVEAGKVPHTEKDFGGYDKRNGADNSTGVSTANIDNQTENSPKYYRWTPDDKRGDK